MYVTLKLHFEKCKHCKILFPCASGEGEGRVEGGGGGSRKGRYNCMPLYIYIYIMCNYRQHQQGGHLHAWLSNCMLHYSSVLAVQRGKIIGLCKCVENNTLIRRGYTLFTFKNNCTHYSSCDFGNFQLDSDIQAVKVWLAMSVMHLEMQSLTNYKIWIQFQHD